MAPPETTALGALIAHITGGHIIADDEPADAVEKKPRSFQPMNINYGLLPPIEVPKTDGDGKRIKGKDKSFAKKRAASRRALVDVERWLNETSLGVAAE